MWVSLVLGTLAASAISAVPPQPPQEEPRARLERINSLLREGRAEDLDKLDAELRALDPSLRAETVPGLIEAMKHVEKPNKAVRLVRLLDGVAPPADERVKAFFHSQAARRHCELLSEHLDLHRYELKPEGGRPKQNAEYARESLSCLEKGFMGEGLLESASLSEPSTAAARIFKVMRSPKTDDYLREAAATQLVALLPQVPGVRSEVEQLAISSKDRLLRGYALLALTPVFPEPLLEDARMLKRRALGSEACSSADTRGDVMQEEASDVQCTTYEEALGPQTLNAPECFMMQKMDHPSLPLSAFVRRCPSAPRTPWAGRWYIQIGYGDFGQKKMWYREHVSDEKFFMAFVDTGHGGPLTYRSGGWLANGRLFWFNSWPFGDWVPPKGFSQDVSDLYTAAPFAPLSLGVDVYVRKAQAQQLSISVVTGGGVRQDCQVRTLQELAVPPERCQLPDLQMGRDNCRIDATLDLSKVARPRLVSAARPRCDETDN